MVKSACVLIPARGGSKSIPGKNVRPFCGHPLLEWSVAAGLESQRVDRVIVSTDDPEIAEVARRAGAEVPFLRPAHLALDDTLDLPVFQHALQWLEEQEGYAPEAFVQLRPTSPLRPSGLVDLALGILDADPAIESVRAVTPSGENPHKMWRMAAGGRLESLLTLPDVPEPFNQPRQALPPTYWQTGHIDVIRRPTIVQKGSLSGDRVHAVLMERELAVDLDTELDWVRGEALARGTRIPLVRPPAPRIPEDLHLVILDFDGVLTDDRVWVDREGREMVAAHRGDGMGLSRLRRAGVEVRVLSSEVDGVVAARCRKLGIPVEQGVKDKGAVLDRWFAEAGLTREQVIFVGNDVNDLPAFDRVDFSVAVADAHAEVRRRARWVLQRRGGHGAVRELADFILEAQGA